MNLRALVPTSPNMARKKSEPPAPESEAWPLDKRLAAHELVKPGQFISSSGGQVEAAKIQEIAGLLWFQEGISDADRDAKIVKAMDLFASIKPAEGIEAMLAAQMVGAHHAAMECLRRAMIPSQSFEGRKQSLDYAQRLMALYIQQLAALDKHRGKGQQKITVERVQVAAGGQAIVGNVSSETAPQARQSRRKVAPPQIAHHPAETSPLDALDEAKPKSKSRAR